MFPAMKWKNIICSLSQLNTDCKWHSRAVAFLSGNEFKENVQLLISKLWSLSFFSRCGASVLLDPPGFCFTWAGARATYGVCKGKVHSFRVFRHGNCWRKCKFLWQENWHSVEIKELSLGRGEWGVQEEGSTGVSSAPNACKTFGGCSHVAIAHLSCFNCEYSRWLFFLQTGISSEHCHSYNCVFIFLKTNHIATVLTGLDEQSVTEHDVDKNQLFFSLLSKDKAIVSGSSSVCWLDLCLSWFEIVFRCAYEVGIQAYTYCGVFVKGGYGSANWFIFFVKSRFCI